MREEPWQRAEISGPKRAHVINNPRIVSSLIKRASRPILLVGGEAVGSSAIDYAIQLSEAADMPIVTTPSTLKAFGEKGYTEVHPMSAVEIGERLRDPDWEGLDGSGQYDLALLMGFKYYVAWLILSGLKHYAERGESYLTTVSLDPYYQPHASWSLPNLPPDRWEENIKGVLQHLRR
jgi:acetyl-CoA decarbonylase/synthase complex subunit epsilon